MLPPFSVVAFRVSVGAIPCGCPRTQPIPRVHPGKTGYYPFPEWSVQGIAPTVKMAPGCLPEAIEKAYGTSSQRFSAPEQILVSLCSLGKLNVHLNARGMQGDHKGRPAPLVR